MTTVSFILNGKAKEKRISESLTKRVLEYVKKVGYKPNQLAQSLRTGQSKILGLIVEDISNPFFSNVAKYIERIAYENGYHIIYCSMDNDATKAKELIQLFYDRQVDGYIITPPEGLEETLSNLHKNNVPLVLFDRYIPQLETHYVVLDNFKGAYEATTHLLNNPKNRKVGFVSLYSTQTQMRDRLEGYMKAVDDFQQQAYIKKVRLDEDEQSVMEQLYNFIHENHLDAVLFATNYLAIDGLKAVKEYGMNLPHMVAFDDHTLFKLHEPDISVVTQDTSAIANELIHTLLNEIKGKNKELQKIVIPCELLVRGSSATVNELKEQTSSK